MKFLSVGYLATAVAASVVRRDLATISGVLSTAGTGLDGLITATKSFSADSSAFLDIMNMAIQGVKDEEAKVQPLPVLSIGDAIGLTQPTKDLQTKGDALLASVKDKKAAFAAAGLCDVMLLHFTDLKTGSDALSKTIVSKVPAYVQSIAQSLAAPLGQDLADVVNLFSATNCKNAVGATPAASTSAAPTSVAPTSAAPTSTEPATTATPTVPATTSNGSSPTTTAPGPGNGTCPAASTVTVTSTDTEDCTPTPTCTKTPPVTVTATTKACPTGSKLPW